MEKNTHYTDLLRQYKLANQDRYGIVRIGIFGSVARGEQTERSDIDIFVDLKDPDYFILCDIKDDLQQLFNMNVDLIRYRPSLSPELIKNIHTDGIEA